MNIHLEKINNRYRGPFEKHKTAFFAKQIASSLLAVEAENNDNSQDIKNMLRNSETLGFGSQDTGNIISDRENLRDRISVIEDEATNMLRELDAN